MVKQPRRQNRMLASDWGPACRSDVPSVLLTPAQTSGSAQPVTFVERTNTLGVHPCIMPRILLHDHLLYMHQHAASTNSHFTCLTSGRKHAEHGSSCPRKVMKVQVERRTARLQVVRRPCPQTAGWPPRCRSLIRCGCTAAASELDSWYGRTLKF